MADTTLIKDGMHKEIISPVFLITAAIRQSLCETLEGTQAMALCLPYSAADACLDAEISSHP